MTDYGFLAGLGAAILLTPLVRILARALGFVDMPRPDRFHDTPTPYLGGIAVFGALLLGLAATRGFPTGPGARHSSEVILLLVGAASLLLGIADDWRGLSPPLKFAGQVGITTLFLAVAGPGPTRSATWDGPLGLVWIVGFMNAFNFLDNMDGVLAGVSFIAALALSTLGILHGVPGMAWLLVLAGALLGFLIFNAPPARIFLGDAGSLFLGGILSATAWEFASVASAESGTTLIPAGASAAGTRIIWLALPLLFAYPLFDICFVTFTRLRRRQSPWVGGRDHTTHRLRTWVGGTRRALAIVYLLSILGAAGALMTALSAGRFWLLPYWILGLLFVGLGIRLARVPIQ